MINEIDIDSVISELRVELDRIDRAILVFEKLALEKKASRRRPYRYAAARPRRAEAGQTTQSSANPS